MLSRVFATRNESRETFSLFELVPVCYVVYLQIWLILLRAIFAGIEDTGTYENGCRKNKVLRAWAAAATRARYLSILMTREISAR